MRKPRQDPVYIQSFGAVPVVRRNMREKYRLSLKPHIHAISWMESPERERVSAAGAERVTYTAQTSPSAIPFSVFRARLSS